jgi:hypothetical protein
MNVNKKYKNSVFSLLYEDTDALRETYLALPGTSIGENEKIELNTLTNVLFMEQINDVSFTVGNRLVVLFEHQSSVNPNMPLRVLLYIARLYEKNIERKKLYSKKKIEIPKPEFYVLYNGVDPFPEQATLKLSDAFKEKTNIALELEVKVYNINEGHNKEILKKSKSLSGYALFVEKVREFSRESGSFEEGMVQAIDWCEKHDVLAAFLKQHDSEVRNMLITEWNTEEAKEVWQQEAREEAREEERKKSAAKIAQSEAKAVQFEAKAAQYEALVAQSEATIAELKRQLAQLTQRKGH